MSQGYYSYCCFGFPASGFVSNTKITEAYPAGTGILDASGPKGPGDELSVGRPIEEFVRAGVQRHCPDSQKVLLVHGANWTWVQVVRPCAKTAELDVCWPVSFVVEDASTKVLVVEAHISPKVL